MYVGSNPIKYIDPSGLATVCLREGAATFGHVGISPGIGKYTSGFYPQSGVPGNPITGTAGIVQLDKKPVLECKVINTTAEQDRLMAEYIRMSSQATPSDYALLTNNCTNFVSEVLRQGGVLVPSASPLPRLYFKALPGEPFRP